jgi:hypothetical protein
MLNLAIGMRVRNRHVLYLNSAILAEFLELV